MYSIAAEAKEIPLKGRDNHAGNLKASIYVVLDRARTSYPLMDRGEKEMLYIP
ncbi:MAG: hypothetical protein H7Y03_07385 [Chitinophagaceae bacterium]|nr:hypothetical protein [Chitinophagaceae bacterium]